MKEQTKTLRIYNFSHPLMNTEWLSIQSDKYKNSLSFKWEIVGTYQEADVVVWDGVITLKNKEVINSMMEDFRKSKILLLSGESLTLFKNHPLVNLVDLRDIKYVELAGWNVLPEEILAAIEHCHQKSNHV